MGLFDGWKMPDIGQGVEEFRATPGAVLLDVRSRQEFQEDHIPGSQNIPLSSLEEAAGLTENKEIPAVRLLLQRSQKRPGGPCAAAHGVRQCEKYRRHRHLDRSGGALIEKLGPKGARRGQIRAEPPQKQRPRLFCGRRGRCAFVRRAVR